MNELPNLAGVATSDLVEQIGGSGFKASYINWARTLHLLHANAPGWLPELVPTVDGALVHAAPVGAFLFIRFRHVDGTTTPPVPQAIMDNKNNAIPLDRITARDVTDTHVRGVCKAAAVTFGLAYELWAKLPLESGYVEGEDAPQPEPAPKLTGKPQDGMTILDFPFERQPIIQEHADNIRELAEGGQIDKAAAAWKEAQLPHEEKAAVWFLLPSNHRSAITKLLRGKAA